MDLQPIQHMVCTGLFYSVLRGQLHVTKMQRPVWLHRVNIWESFPGINYGDGRVTRHAVSIPSVGLMNSMPENYHVFNFIRVPSCVLGFIFRREHGSGRFIDVVADDNTSKELASKYVFQICSDKLYCLIRITIQHFVPYSATDGLHGPLSMSFWYTKFTCVHKCLSHD